MNYLLTIEYEGTRYEGWQRQKKTTQTIQGKLEAGTIQNDRKRG